MSQPVPSPIPPTILASAVLLLGLTFSGCVAVNTSEGTKLMTINGFKKHTRGNLVGSLQVAEEVTRGALQYRVDKRRWPRNREEILQGLVRSGRKPEFAGEMVSLELSWEQEVPTYSFLMASGASWIVRIRLTHTEP